MVVLQLLKAPPKALWTCSKDKSKSHPTVLRNICKAIPYHTLRYSKVGCMPKIPEPLSLTPNRQCRHRSIASLVNLFSSPTQRLKVETQRRLRPDSPPPGQSWRATCSLGPLPVASAFSPSFAPTGLWLMPKTGRLAWRASWPSKERSAWWGTSQPFVRSSFLCK